MGLWGRLGHLFTGRRLDLPAEHRAQLVLAPKEHVLTWASLRGGDSTVATDQALHRPVPGGGFVRLPWEAVLHGTWDAQRESFTLDVLGDDGQRERHVLLLDDHGRLPEVLRERVQASIVVSRHVALAGSRGVRIVGRRTGGDVSWHVVPDAGVDVEDPAVRDAVERALRETRDQLGA